MSVGFMVFSFSASSSSLSAFFSALARLLIERESRGSSPTCDFSLPSSYLGPVCSSALVEWWC